MGFTKVEDRIVGLIEVTDLKYSEILLLSRILTLADNNDNACIASNDYFATFMHTSERNIRKYLAKLKENELIKTFEKKKGMKNTTRYIYPQHKIINKLLAEFDSDEPAEQSGMNQRNNWVKPAEQSGMNQRNNWVKPAEQFDPLIIDDKRRDKMTRDMTPSPSELLENTTYTEELKLWNFKIKVIDLWSQDKLNNRDIADKLGVDINKINPIITEYVNNNRQYPIKPKKYLHDIYGNKTNFEPDDVLPFDQYSNKPIDISNINILDLSEVYTYFSNTHADNNGFIPLNKDELRQVYLDKYDIDVYNLENYTDYTN